MQANCAGRPQSGQVGLRWWFNRILMMGLGLTVIPAFAGIQDLYSIL